MKFTPKSVWIIHLYERAFNRARKPVSTIPLPNICNTNKNPLQMLGTIKMLVHLGRTKVILKFIVCGILASSAIIGADICVQHMRTIRP